MGINPNELVINDGNYQRYLDPAVNGEKVARGLIPRNYAQHPVGSGLGAVAGLTIPLIPRSEWSARIKEMEEAKTRLSDYRRIGNNGLPIPSLDQNGQGFCWAYSTGMALMMSRMMSNQPYVRLSPHAVACKIKGFRDEGGWGALSMEFAVKNGYPSDKFWPQKSMSRSYDTLTVWGNAEKHRVQEGYWDLDAKVYDRNLTFDQVMTCLMMRIPIVGDFNWWGHSVCLLDPVEVEPGSFGVRIINSWTDNWGNLGEGVLQGNKAIPDGAVAPRVTTASQD